MALSHYIGEKIKSTALNLFLRRASLGKPINYEEAETTAAKWVAAQERQRKSTKPSTPVHRLPPAKQGEIGEHNAVELLIAKVMRLAQRALEDPLPKPKRAPRVPFLKKAPVVVNDPKTSPGDVLLPTEQPATTPQPLTSDPDLVAALPLVFTSGSTQLINDEEYPPRWRESIATSNWRQSVETNLRIQREREERRRDRWVG
jgi:hypothetical protein